MVIMLANVNVCIAEEKHAVQPTESEIKEYLKQRLERTIELANNGNVVFQTELGRMYYFGELGVERNLEESFKWYKMAALNGDSGAQFELGFMYSNGEGVEKNGVNSSDWYIKSAENGYGGAYVIVGNRYIKGKGVAKSCEKAIYWYNKAAESNWNRSIAIDHLANLYIKGKCVVQSYQTACKYYLVYNKLVSYGKHYYEMEKIRNNLSKKEIALAEEQAHMWLKEHAPEKQF